MKNNKRFYSIELVYYGSKEHLDYALYECYFISNYAYILHDKDINDDGTPKKAHFHVYMTFNQQLSLSRMSKLFTYYFQEDIGLNLLQVIKNDLQCCYDYLTHKFEKGKYKYSEEDIVCTNLRVFKRNTSVNNTSYDILLDMENGLSLRMLAMKYGREFIINYQRYKDFFNEMTFEEQHCSNVVLDDKPTPFIE